MTIVQLEYFLAVANHRSLAAAAKHCFVTPGALSIQITSLENELGVTLLDRSKKPIVPTEAGKAFLEQAKKALVEFHKAREKIDNIKGNISGYLRIGVITTVSPYLMPIFIPRFIKKCPDIKLRIHEMYLDDIIQALAFDNIDIAILTGGESDIRIFETDLFDDKFYMYVSPENELYGRKEIMLEDIDIEKLLILDEGHWMRRQCPRNHTLRLCEAREAVDPQFDFVNGSLESLMYTVDRTSCATVVPGMAIRYIPEEKRDRIIPLGGTDAKRKITMAIARTYIRESLVALVKETVMEIAKEEFALAEYLIP